MAGGSGSGKTTVVPADRGDLRLEERAALSYDHPDSLETDLLVRHPGTRVGSR